MTSYGIKVSFDGYWDSYVWVPTGNSWIPSNTYPLLPESAVNGLAQMLSPVTISSSDALAVGEVQWVGSGSQPVGCAQVTVDDDDSATVLYFDDNGNPTTAQSGTDANNGQFLIANLTPGAAPQFAAAVNAATASTSVPFVYAHGLAFPTINFLAPTYSTNPTPPGCNPPADDDSVPDDDATTDDDTAADDDTLTDDDDGDDDD
jgi:hypothetical protein